MMVRGGLFTRVAPSSRPQLYRVVNWIAVEAIESMALISGMECVNAVT